MLMSYFSVDPLLVFEKFWYIYFTAWFVKFTG